MIYVTETIRIRKFDEFNLIIEENKPVEKTTGEIKYEWKNIGYYGNLQSALMGVLKKRLFNTAEEELTIKDLCAKITQIGDEIKESIRKGE